MGDGYCDDHLNHMDCFFDDGDCCNGGDLSFCLDCICHNLLSTTTPSIMTIQNDCVRWLPFTKQSN